MGCTCSKDVDEGARNFDDLNEPAPTTRTTNAAVDKSTEKRLNKYTSNSIPATAQPAIMEPERESLDGRTPALQSGMGGRMSFEGAKRPSNDGHVVGSIGLTAPAALTPSIQPQNERENVAANGNHSPQQHSGHTPALGGGGGRSRFVSQISTQERKTPKVEHPPMDEEEAKAAILREEMRHEVTAARAGFGGDDFTDQEPEETPNKAAEHVEVEEMQEFDADTDDDKHNDTKPLTDASPKAHASTITTTGGTFPSDEWMKTNGLTAPPHVHWWQDKSCIYLEVDITSPSDEEITVQDSVLNYRGTSAGVRYGFVFAFQNPVKDYTQSLENGKTLITLTKKSPTPWSGLLNADRKQMSTIGWVKLDFNRTADSDEDEDD